MPLSVGEKLGPYEVLSQLGGEHKLLFSGIAGKSEWRLLLNSGAMEMYGQFSPDGQRIAYQSNESGAPEIYMTDFPYARHTRRISVAGGREPRWGRDGKELFYRAPDDNLMAIRLEKEAEVEAAHPVALFKVHFPETTDGFHYAVTGDRQRFLVVSGMLQQRSRDLSVVFNWPQLLRAERPPLAKYD